MLNLLMRSKCLLKLAKMMRTLNKIITPLVQHVALQT